MGDHGSLRLPWINKQEIIAVACTAKGNLQWHHKDRLLVGTEGRFSNDGREL